MDTEKLRQEAIELRKEKHQMIKTELNAELNDGHDLAIVYTPGVSAPCLAIKEDLSLTMTWRGNVVAVISDGTRVLGLGDIGAAASMPVMEGKSALYKKFGNIDAIPIVLDTKDKDEFIHTVKLLEKNFAGINLEDISSPKCYDIEDELKKIMNIPVFHDDQHGTAIAALAALLRNRIYGDGQHPGNRNHVDPCAGDHQSRYQRRRRCRHSYCKTASGRRRKG